ncbi:MAG: carbonic anhydrase [Candidatus Eisenbacteria bacterium]|nr:carbonic anhydrase [Candidatus Eisenbacteria bacterium]
MPRNLLGRNQAWARRTSEDDPEFFERLSRGQAPRYMWIGCSDSRVPSGKVVDLPPGQIFVHRNIANLALPSDTNCMSALQYAVAVLRVEHVIVCGHNGCGGIRAAVDGRATGSIDAWLGPVRDLREKHRAALPPADDMGALCDRLSEINVIEQVLNIARTPFLREAWAQGQAVAVHGWVYDIRSGLIKDLGVTVSRAEEVAGVDAALERPDSRGASC